MTAPADDRVTGRVLGDFVVGDKLGEGGFGAVYHAEQRGLGREAVVKVLRPSVAARRDVIERFTLEARLASRFDHPYAAHVYAFGVEPDGLLWIAMERVRGTRLDELIRQNGPMPPDRLVPFLERLCEVVQSAHDQGIVHRDIKPANIMVIARAGRLLPKLLDFGVAKEIAQQEVVASDPLEPPATVLTQAGRVVGSPPYMAPEQWDEGEVGPWTDQYALAIVAYEALTGKRPFRGTSIEALRDAHCHARLPPLPESLPRGLHEVLARAAAKASADRYAGVMEVATAARRGAGLAAPSETTLPGLAEATRAAWLSRAPTPIAEALAALPRARSGASLIDAVTAAASTIARWLGVLALASRSRLGPLDATTDDDAAALLKALRRRPLRDVEWLELAAHLARPYAAKRELWPVPELVELAAAPEPRETLAELLRDARAVAEDDAIRVATERIADLERALGALSWLCDYELVREVWGTQELWVGLERGARPALDTLSGSAPDDDRVVLHDRDGATAVLLSPLVEIAEPSPGQRADVFILAGPARGGSGGALLASPVRGFERESAELWGWLAANVLADQSADAASTHDTRAPYPGLLAFGADDSGSFVGREREVTALVNRLRSHPLLAVVGPSGVGKSSLLHAGVVPTLPVGWRAETLRPGRAPLAALGALLARLDQAAPYRDAPAESLVRDPAALAAALDAAAERLAVTLVVIVDQGEELFTLCGDPAERDGFVTALAAASGARTPRVRVVVAMRDDFLCRMDELAGWQGRLAGAVHLLSMPDPAALLRIVTEPARRQGHDFDDPSLPGEIVAAAAGQAGALPLLAFAMARLWDQRDRHFNRLLRRVHDAAGGVAGALGLHAEGVLAAMTPADQRGVRVVFQRLLTTEGTRAVASRRELVDVLGTGARGEALLDRLLAERLLVSSEDEAGARVEVIHEALATAWPRLVGWRREDLEGARLREQVTRAARDWDRRGRDRGLLWRGDAFDELRAWRRRHGAALSELEAAFVDASASAVQRSRRGLLAVGCIALVVLVVGVVLLVRSGRDARDGRAIAMARLRASFEERGRAALLAGDAPRALLYLAEASRLGAGSRAFELLVARAARPIEAEQGSVTAHASTQQYQAFSADRARLVTAGADRTVALWDVMTGRPVFTVNTDGPIGHVAVLDDGAVAILQDGKLVAWDAAGKPRWSISTGHRGDWLQVATTSTGTWVASIGDDGLRIWDGRTGASHAVFDNEVPVTAVAFDRSGARVVAGDDAGVIRVWDLATRGLVSTCAAAAGRISDLEVSRDDLRVAVASWDATASICDAMSGARVHRLSGHQGPVISVEWTPDGVRLLTGSWDGQARVWSLSGDAAVTTMTGHVGHLSSARFSDDARSVVTAGVDRTVRVWDAGTGLPLLVLPGHQSQVTDAAFGPGVDGRVVSTGYDAVIRTWDVAAAIAGTVHSDHDGQITDLVFAPDGALAATVSFDGTAVVRELPSGRLAERLRGHQAWIGAAAFDATGTRLATASDDATAMLWKVPEGALLATLRGHEKPINTVAFARDGATVATAGDDQTLRLWRADGTAIAKLDAGAVVWRLAFDPTGHSLVSAGESGHLAIWSVAESAQSRTLVGHRDRVWDVAFSADGRWVASGGADQVVRIWDPATGLVVHSLVGHDGAVVKVRFTPDGRLLSAADDGMVFVWDVTTGERLALLDSRGTFVWDVDVDRDGALAVTTGFDGHVRVWDLRTYRLLLDDAGHAGGAARARFTPDGQHVVSAGFDGRTVIWDLTGDSRGPEALAELVRCRVPLRLERDTPLPAEPGGPGCPPQE